MSCLAWNYLGLRNLRTKRELVELIREKDPTVVFLAETLIDEVRLEFIQNSINFGHRWVVPKVGHSGGLVLYWRSLINLTIEGSNKIFMDVVIDRGLESEWHLTGFYGELDTARRNKVWDKLMSLNSRLERPWLCVVILINLLDRMRNWEEQLNPITICNSLEM